MYERKNKVRKEENEKGSSVITYLISILLWPPPPNLHRHRGVLQCSRQSFWALFLKTSPHFRRAAIVIWMQHHLIWRERMGVSGTFFPANLLAKKRKSKRNTTKANMHHNKYTTT